MIVCGQKKILIHVNTCKHRFRVNLWDRILADSLASVNNGYEIKYPLLWSKLVRSRFLQD